MKIKLEFFIVFCCVILAGCEKEKPLPVDTPVEPQVEKIVIIRAIAGANGTISLAGIISLKAGDSKLFTITPDTGYSIFKLKVNGIEQKLISNTYEFKSVGVESDSVIVVAEFISNDILTLTKGSEKKLYPWFLKGYEYYDFDNNFVYSVSLDTEKLSRKSFYYIDGNMEAFDQQGVLVANGKWSLDGKNFIQGGVNTVVELTEKNILVSETYQPAKWQN